jgi:hypothetical protein
MLFQLVAAKEGLPKAYYDSTASGISTILPGAGAGAELIS